MLIGYGTNADCYETCMANAQPVTDAPLSAFGRGAYLFTGVMDNTDVFFKFGQAAIGGVNDGGDHGDHR